MIAYLCENAGNITVVSVISAAVCSVIAKMVRDKRSGKASCGCGCEGCSHKCH